MEDASSETMGQLQLLENTFYCNNVTPHSVWGYIITASPRIKTNDFYLSEKHKSI